MRTFTGHVDKDCNHSTNDWRSLTWIFINRKPLVNDQKIHICKGACHEDELRYSQGEKVSPFFLSVIVKKLNKETKHHVNYSKYDCHFHFQTIDKRHLVMSHFPDRINPNWKYTIKWLNKWWVICLNYCKTAAEKTKVETKKLVIDKPTVPHEKNNSPKPNISIQGYQQRDSKQHMSHISKHNANKESKCNYVKWSWV